MHLQWGWARVFLGRGHLWLCSDILLRPAPLFSPHNGPGAGYGLLSYPPPSSDRAAGPAMVQPPLEAACRCSPLGPGAAVNSQWLCAGRAGAAAGGSSPSPGELAESAASPPHCQPRLGTRGGPGSGQQQGELVFPTAELVSSQLREQEGRPPLEVLGSMVIKHQLYARHLLSSSAGALSRFSATIDRQGS